MAAVTAPVAVDESLVQFTSSIGTRRLASVLRQLSHNASVNARVIVSLQHSIEEIRSTVNQEHDSIIQRLDNEMRLRLELENTVQDQRKRIDKFEATYALQQKVDDHVHKLNENIQRALTFIQEIESGSGERVTKFVSGYIESFVPKWYAGVSGAMLDNVKRMVLESADEAASNLDKRALECEDKAEQDLLKTQASIIQQLHRLNEERRRELSKARSEIFERFTETEHRTDQLVAQSKFVQEKRHSATRRRLQSLEESACALRSTLCLEDTLCRELHNLMVAHVFGQDDIRGTSLKVSPEADVTRDEKDVDASVPGEQRGLDAAELFARMNADDCIRDLRIRRVTQTPHFIAQRTMLQKEFSERMDFLKTDLHNDLVAEIFDLQRELRGKVGTNKLGELLDQYRDEGLYSNVKLLMQDMTEIKTSKVDMVLFVEGLRSKADVRAMDTKVDKALINSQIEVIERKLDDVVACSTRTDHRVMRMENQMSNPRRGTVTVVSSAPSRHPQEHPQLIEDRRGSSKGKLIRGSRRLSAAGSGYTSPYRHSVSPTGDDYNDPFTPSTSVRPATSGKPHEVQSLVDQMLERGFPPQVVVHESPREISRLHHAVVKTSHEKQVASLMAENDPDVELPSIGGPKPAVVNESPIASSSARKPPSAAITSARRNRSAQPVTVSGAPISTEPPPTSQQSPKSCAGLIPLTRSQVAYCTALDTDAPQNSGLGFAIGMKCGEKRDY